MVPALSTKKLLRLGSATFGRCSVYRKNASDDVRNGTAKRLHAKTRTGPSVRSSGDHGRIVLDSARVGHKYMGRYFYANAARLDRQRKEERRITLSDCPCAATLRDICAGDLFGRMRGTVARTGRTGHAITEGTEPHAG